MLYVFFSPISFQMTVEIFDYLDALIHLEEASKCKKIMFLLK